jgi:hypothetical protein
MVHVRPVDDSEVHLVSELDLVHQASVLRAKCKRMEEKEDSSRTEGR